MAALDRPNPSATAAMPAAREAIPSLFTDHRRQLVLLAAWALVVGASLFYAIDNARRHNLAVATEGARNIFRMAVVTRQWNSNHGGVYVQVTDKIQPNPYLKHPQRELTTTGGVTLTLINPAYMTRLIAELAAREGGVALHITSLRPIRPANAPDLWESQALRAFETGQAEVSGLDGHGESTQLRYMAPLKVQQSCLGCHADQGYKLGDIRGGISVSVPYAPIAATTREAVRHAGLIHVVVFVLVAALGLAGLQALRQRWETLQRTIDELDATREELIEREKMASLGQLVAGFAHEINTPIGVAFAAVSQAEVGYQRLETLIRREEVSESELREVIAALREGDTLAVGNLRRAAELLQSFKRTSVDRSAEVERDFNLREVIDDVVLSLRSPIRHSRTQVAVDCPGDLLLNGMPGLIEQLLSNLILNAIDHGFGRGERPGRIDIGASLGSDGQLSIRFADTGAGMTDTVRRRAFEPFFTTARGRGGSGLGLYLCYNIVTARLGGSISCDSTLGEGTRFLIRFPVHLATLGTALPVEACR